MKNFCDDPEEIGNKESWVRRRIKTGEGQVKRNKVNNQKQADQKVDSYFYPNLPRKLGKANVWRRLREKVGADQREKSGGKKPEKGQAETVAEIFRFFVPDAQRALIADYLEFHNSQEKVSLTPAG